GTASYYREEISRWMRPELPSSNVSIDVAAQRAVDYLQVNAAQAGNWFVTLPQPRNPAMQMFWRLPPEQADPSRGRRGGFGEATLDPNSGQAL
ncbi:PepSY-associated TM helix domain-containing protein, partial [Mesorhizobium sp. M8A.F.Ca.ET.161.01.1.1]